MDIEALIQQVATPDWLAQEGVMFALDEAKGAKFRCHVHKHRHSPTSYSGYARRPVVSSGGMRCFTAVVLRNRKGLKGRKKKAVARIALFESERYARETAFLWHCQLKGVDVDGVMPGHMSWQERHRLVKQLKGTERLCEIGGPRPVLLENGRKVPEATEEKEPPTSEHQDPQTAGATVNETKESTDTTEHS